jgi:hypothetical protein
MSIRLKTFIGFGVLLTLMIAQGFYLLGQEREIGAAGMTIYERPMQANHHAHLATAAFDRADVELSRSIGKGRGPSSSACPPTSSRPSQWSRSARRARRRAGWPSK